MYKRVPTVAITHKRLKPIEIARAFADRNVFVWNGHNFAVETARRLNLLETGGALRTGLAHYNTESEVDFALGILDDL
jgi:selenocysteine lyase/cysteine desulfurase